MEAASVAVACGLALCGMLAHVFTHPTGRPCSVLLPKSWIETNHTHQCSILRKRALPS